MFKNYKNRFKHNTSFVSRFSTIRRHKSSSGSNAHSPVARSRVKGGQQHLSSSLHLEHTSHHQSGSRGGGRGGGGGGGIPTSVSNDSVSRDTTYDTKTKNSDGQFFVTLLSFLLFFLFLLFSSSLFIFYSFFFYSNFFFSLSFSERSSLFLTLSNVILSLSTFLS